MHDVTPDGDGWIICIPICVFLCKADTIFPIVDAIGAGAGAARYA